VIVTAQTLIQDALRGLGVLDPTETLEAEDADGGLRALNMMVDAWLLDEFYAYAILEVIATFAGKTASIGTGQAINTPRPVGIAPGCFYNKSAGASVQSYPIAQLTREQYSNIGYKDVPNEYPDAFYFDSAYPVGQIIVYGVPSAPVEYHFMVWQQLSQFSDLVTQYNFAPGYGRLLKLALMQELSPEYQAPMPPESIAALNQVRRAVKRVNAKVPILNIGPESAPVPSAGGPRFNILSGGR
jgi:hypothetical protein